MNICYFQLKHEGLPMYMRATTTAPTHVYVHTWARLQIPFLGKSQPIITRK